MRRVSYERSLEHCFPEIAKQWHPWKNGDLKPSYIGKKSSFRAWWYLPYDDPRTGKHFDFEWQGSVISRTQDKRGCPYLSGQCVWVGFNDLASNYPELSKQWHPIKNGNLKPRDVSYGSEKKVWWLMPYDDPNTGRHFDFEWETTIYQRTSNNSGCPFLSGHAIWRGFNDLATTNPELARQWHPDRNGQLGPTEVARASNKKVWWFLPYDDPKTGKHFEFEWQATINSRANDGVGCPYLSGNAVWTGFNDLSTLKPELAEQWHPTKNKELRPTKVAVNCMKKVWWYQSYYDPATGKHFDFEWEAQISSRANGAGCPFLSGRSIWKGFNDLKTLRPDIAAQWHPTKNGQLKPTDVTAVSNKRVWWYFQYDDPFTQKHFDFEWKERICERIRDKYSCPIVVGKRVWEGFNDLASIYPDIIREWDFAKNRNIKPTEVAAYSSRKVWWICSYCGKSWRSVIRSRIKGHGHGCELYGVGT